MVNIPQAKFPGASGYNFSQVPRADIPRAQFKRNHNYKTTFDSGYLVPFFADEVVPGDTFNLDVAMLCRSSSPFIKPVMDNMYLDTQFFFVPNRLIWSNWEKLMGAQTNPGDSTDYLTPVMTAPASTGHAIGSLSDYLGIPTGIATLQHSSMWHRAYNLIYNTWYRDENLQNSVTVDTGDGPDTSSNYALLKRGKRHDYFTSCLPWPQKPLALYPNGVTIPLGTSANVWGSEDTTVKMALQRYDVNTAVYAGQVNSAAGTGILSNTQSANYAVNLVKKSTPGYVTSGLYADLSTATAASINSLRLAFQLQKLAERDARGGTRYTEIINSHFGVVSPDFRLQRPELLASNTNTIIVNPIAQMSAQAESGTTTPQGNLSGIVASTGRNGFTKSFVEHGVILGIMSVRADMTYQHGLHRMFSRRSRFDYYWPALAHIGEQTVLNKEIYAQNDANDSLVFGYQERWAEYKYKPSMVTGKFRSTASGTLDVWHLAQKFTSLPSLNTTFIQETPPVDRVIAVNTEPQWIFDSHFTINCVRPMPLYSVPGLIDHF